MIEPRARTRTAEASFVRLVRTHQAGLWRYLRFLGCDPAQAEDLVQEAFLRVWRGSFEERSPAATASYLRTVARNLVIDQARRKKVRPALRDLDEADAVWDEYEGDDDARGYRDALKLCLERLGSRARLALNLFYREGRSREDIGATMGIKAGGVKTLLHRTREVLRTCIEERIGA